MATELLQGDQYISATSRLIAEAKTGQNGGLNPASTMGMKPGEKLPRSKVAQAILASDPVVATAGENFQTRKVSSAQAVKTNPGAAGRTGAVARVPTSILDRGNAQKSALLNTMSARGKRGK